MINIKKYSPESKIIWDEFVKLSKNYHFFFLRNYMDYHAERFNDHSLMFYDKKGALIALLPANYSNEMLFSHQGLTFGGLIIKSSIKQKDIIDIFDNIKKYLQENKIRSLHYKKIPYIYHTIPADEDLYSLFRCDAKLIRRDVSSAIKIDNQIKYSKGRKWTLKKLTETEIQYNLVDNDDIPVFWENLTQVILTQHDVKPTHSAMEIIQLKNAFPNEIKFYTAIKNNKQIAGAVIFETSVVAHTQYLYNTIEGREIGALDGLIDYLIKNIYMDKAYFDFGISNEDNGKYLNDGLIAQKEGFGARAIVHDFYEILAND